MTPDEFLKAKEIIGTEIADHEVFTRTSATELMAMYYNYKIEDMGHKGALGIGEVGAFGIIRPPEGQEPDIGYIDYVVYSPIKAIICDKKSYSHILLGLINVLVILDRKEF